MSASTFEQDRAAVEAAMRAAGWEGLGNGCVLAQDRENLRAMVDGLAHHIRDAHRAPTLLEQAALDLGRRVCGAPAPCTRDALARDVMHPEELATFEPALIDAAIRRASDALSAERWGLPPSTYAVARRAAAILRSGRARGT
jgi:hypothetical protein